jgi:arylsulfatase
MSEFAAVQHCLFLFLHKGQTAERKQPIFWEHQGNYAVRDGKWKLVYRRCENEQIGWELYDMESDRTELINLAEQYEEKVRYMIEIWKDWAERCDVKPWPLHPIPDGEKDWSNLPWMW